MPSKLTPTQLQCQCGVLKIIKCAANKDYSSWTCLSCSIKRTWLSENYRSNRPKRKPRSRPPDRAVVGSAEHIAKTSSALRGRKLSDAHRAAIKERWADPAFREKMASIQTAPEYRELRSKKSKEMWIEEGFAAKYKSDAHRQKMSEASKLLWQDPDFRRKVLAAKSTPKHKALMAAIAADSNYKRKLSEAAARLPRVSSLQTALYGILDDLGVSYERETADGNQACIVGPWSFDCAVPRPDKPTLLIECQGDWVHSLPHKAVADKAKSTYIQTYCSDRYELKHLWEHQFACKEFVIDSVKHWLGIDKISAVDFDLRDVVVRIAPAADYKPLLQRHHYLFSAGRGGQTYGAYLGDKIVATCIFSPLPRQNIVIGDFKNNQVRDLSRLCIHPSYNQSNFGSWFISRCIALLPRVYCAIVAYADSTYGHNGGVYLASNFMRVSETAPDYWYRSADGWIMHKKTLYNKAVNLKLKEAEYAVKFGFSKVVGGKKTKFVYIRSS